MTRGGKIGVVCFETLSRSTLQLSRFHIAFTVVVRHPGAARNLRLAPRASDWLWGAPDLSDPESASLQHGSTAKALTLTTPGSKG